jgi:transcriptional regulator with XRE-family HTH domain
MADLAKRIRVARERAGLTQKELADVFGYKPQTVSAWERGEGNSQKPNAPNPQTLAKIAAITNVSLKWLLTGVEDVVTSVTIPAAEQVAGRVVPSVEWDKIRQFLGGDSSIAEGSARSHFPCGPQSFRTFARDRANVPDLEPGDSLIVDPDQAPAPGEYCLVVVDDELLLRRFRPRSEHIELAPYNPDYETKVVPRDRVQIVGAVTETVRPRRH